MKIPKPKRKLHVYKQERQRLMEWCVSLDPTTPEYKELMHRIDSLDKIIKRSGEGFKTVIPALGTMGAVGGIYALQQFGGVLVPKALDAIAARKESKNNHESD